MTVVDPIERLATYVVLLYERLDISAEVLDGVELTGCQQLFRQDREPQLN